MQAAIIGTMNTSPSVDARDLLRTMGIEDLQRRVGYVPMQVHPDFRRVRLPKLTHPFVGAASEILHELIENVDIIAISNSRVPYLLIAWMCLDFERVSALSRLVAVIYIRMAMGHAPDGYRILYWLIGIDEAYVDIASKITSPEEKTPAYYSMARNTWAMRLARSISLSRIENVADQINAGKLAGGVMIDDHVPLLRQWIHLSDAECLLIIRDLFLKIIIAQQETV